MTVLAAAASGLALAAQAPAPMAAPIPDFQSKNVSWTAILLLLYLLVVWRGLRVVTVAGDMFGAVVAGGLVFGFLFQVFVNVGMTMGIAPVTGIPLPFVTVGGSSMVANLVAVGVLQGIHARGRTELR